MKVITVNFEAFHAWGGHSIADEDKQVQVPDDFPLWNEAEQQQYLQAESEDWLAEMVSVAINIPEEMTGE